MPKTVAEIADLCGCPDFGDLIMDFIDRHELGNVTLPSSLSIFPSTVVHFYAPNEQSSLSGMRRERIRSVSSWRRGPPRRDCAYVRKTANIPGFTQLAVVRILLLFSFRSASRTTCECALVSCYRPVGDQPDQDTGMWIVEPDENEDGTLHFEIISIHSIIRAAHLIGHAGNDTIPVHFSHTDSLDSFTAFYVNKYIDYNAHAMVL